MALESELPGFIRQHFRSVWTLETLLFLYRRPGQDWAVAELVQELRASDMLVRGNLASLERSGLVLASSDAASYRYAPASPVLGALTDALETAYRERPVSIINLISAPEDRLQQLADAFRIKGSR